MGEDITDLQKGEDLLKGEDKVLRDLVRVQNNSVTNDQNVSAALYLKSSADKSNATVAEEDLGYEKNATEKERGMINIAVTGLDLASQREEAAREADVSVALKISERETELDVRAEFERFNSRLMSAKLDESSRNMEGKENAANASLFYDGLSLEAAKRAAAEFHLEVESSKLALEEARDGFESASKNLSLLSNVTKLDEVNLANAEENNQALHKKLQEEEQASLSANELQYSSATNASSIESEFMEKERVQKETAQAAYYAHANMSAAKIGLGQAKAQDVAAVNASIMSSNTAKNRMKNATARQVIIQKEVAESNQLVIDAKKKTELATDLWGRARDALLGVNASLQKKQAVLTNRTAQIEKEEQRLMDTEHNANEMRQGESTVQDERNWTKAEWRKAQQAKELAHAAVKTYTVQTVQPANQTWHDVQDAFAAAARENKTAAEQLTQAVHKQQQMEEAEAEADVAEERASVALEAATEKESSLEQALALAEQKVMKTTTDTMSTQMLVARLKAQAQTAQDEALNANEDEELAKNTSAFKKLQVILGNNSVVEFATNVIEATTNHTVAEEALAQASSYAKVCAVDLKKLREENILIQQRIVELKNIAAELKTNVSMRENHLALAKKAHTASSTTLDEANGKLGMEESSQVAAQKHAKKLSGIYDICTHKMQDSEALVVEANKTANSAKQSVKSAGDKVIAAQAATDNATSIAQSNEQRLAAAKAAYQKASATAEAAIAVAKAADADFARKMEEAESSESDADDELALAREEAAEIVSEGKVEMAEMLSKAKEEIELKNETHTLQVDEKVEEAVQREKALNETIAELRRNAELKVAKALKDAAAAEIAALSQSRTDATNVRNSANNEIKEIQSKAGQRIQKINAKVADVMSEVRKEGSKAAEEGKAAALAGGVSAANAQVIAAETQKEAEDEALYRQKSAGEEANDVTTRTAVEVAKVQRDAEFQSNVTLEKGQDSADLAKRTGRHKAQVYDAEGKIAAANQVKANVASINTANTAKAAATKAFEDASKQIKDIQKASASDAAARKKTVEDEATATIKAGEDKVKQIRAKAAEQAAQIRADAEARVEEIKRDCESRKVSPREIRLMGEDKAQVGRKLQALLQMDQGAAAEGSEVEKAMAAQRAKDEARSIYVSLRRERRILQRTMKVEQSKLKRVQTAKRQLESSLTSAQVQQNRRLTKLSEIKQDCNMKRQQKITADAGVTSAMGNVTQAEDAVKAAISAEYTRKADQAQASTLLAAVTQKRASTMQVLSKVKSNETIVLSALHTANLTLARAEEARANAETELSNATKSLKSVKSELIQEKGKLAVKVQEMLETQGVDNAAAASALLSNELAAAARANFTSAHDVLEGTLNRTLSEAQTRRDEAQTDLKQAQAQLANATTIQLLAKETLTEKQSALQDANTELRGARTAAATALELLSNKTAVFAGADVNLNAVLRHRDNLVQNMTKAEEATASLWEELQSSRKEATDAMQMYLSAVEAMQNLTTGLSDRNRTLHQTEQQVYLLKVNATLRSKALQSARTIHLNAKASLSHLKKKLQEAREELLNATARVSAAQSEVRAAAEQEDATRKFAQQRDVVHARLYEFTQDMYREANSSAQKAQEKLNIVRLKRNQTLAVLNHWKLKAHAALAELNITRTAYKSWIAQFEELQEQTSTRQQQLTITQAALEGYNRSEHLATAALKTAKHHLNVSLQAVVAASGDVADVKGSLEAARAEAAEFSQALQLARARIDSGANTSDQLLSDAELETLRQEAAAADKVLHDAQLKKLDAERIMQSQEEQMQRLVTEIQRAKDQKLRADQSLNNTEVSQMLANEALLKSERQLRELQESMTAQKEELETLRRNLEPLEKEKRKAELAHKAAVISIVDNAEDQLEQAQLTAQKVEADYNKAILEVPKLEQLKDSAEEYKLNTGMMFQATADRVAAYKEQYETMKAKKKESDDEVGNIAAEVSRLVEDQTAHDHQQTPGVVNATSMDGLPEGASNDITLLLDTESAF
jgi:hypothetical protein